MASAVRFDRQPFERTVRCRTVANVLSMGFVVRRWLPMLGGEVIESQQRIAVLVQAFRRLLVFHLIVLDESIKRSLGVSLGLGRPNLLQGAFGLRLLVLRQLGEHVGGLMHPTALLAAGRPDFADSFPEAERAVGDRQLRPHIEPPPFQIEQ